MHSFYGCVSVSVNLVFSQQETDKVSASSTTIKLQKKWEETINLIKQYKDSLIDFQFENPTNTQKVYLKENILIIKTFHKNKEYIRKANLKKLNQVRTYKNEGLLLTFEWKKVILTTRNLAIKNHIEKSKSMHFGIKINDKVVIKKLKKAFSELVFLNKK